MANRWTTLLVGVLAGFLITATAITAGGDELRPERSSDLADLVATQEQRNAELRADIETLNAEINELNASQGAETPSPDVPLNELAVTGITPVAGPGVRVVLTDAPADYSPRGVSADMLVVHEHDIQVVVNALWAGGAEAITIQGRRVVATTAVKCVGNTVVVHGTPYAPPYVIEAIGDQTRLETALNSDPEVQIYRDYAQRYQLGYAQTRHDELFMPGYDQPLPTTAEPI